MRIVRAGLVLVSLGVFAHGAVPKEQGSGIAQPMKDLAATPCPG